MSVFNKEQNGENMGKAVPDEYQGVLVIKILSLENLVKLTKYLINIYFRIRND